MIANVCDISVGDFVHTLGDAHLYKNHFEQAKKQLSRSIKNKPQIKLLKKHTNINDFVFEDFEIINYDPHPHISAPVAV